MGVYIKGMEMPMPGRYEAVIIVLDKSTAEIGISPAEGDIGYWKEYPLVPVPPHGQVLTVLRTERECVSRDCDRECGKCDLSLERDEIVGVYDALISMLDTADKAEEGEI
jgi:hypothetical protein